MKLVVGLGNPGKQYEHTRHNIGFMVVDAFAVCFGITSFSKSKNAKALYAKTKVNEQTVEFVKPQTFMNKSGISVSYAKNKHKIPLKDIFVIYDDLDIPLGEYKIIKGKGPRIHNGVASVEEKLGMADFWHVRVGVEGRMPKSRGILGGIKAMMASRDSRNIPGEKYVLMPFREKEKVLRDTVINNVIEDLKTRLKG